MSLSYREKPVQFGDDRGLFGILCVPSHEGPAEGPVVVMPNSGLIHRVGANRIHVLLARALAEQGIRSLRFDLSGIGESERRTGAMSLDEAVYRDAVDALDFVAGQQQADSFVLLGLCSGAYDGLQLATRDLRVVGVVAIDVFGSFRNSRHVFVHYARRFFRFESWRKAVSRPGGALVALLERAGTAKRPQRAIDRAVRPSLSRRELDSMLHSMKEQHVQALFLFTGGLEENYNYEHQFRDCYPKHARSGRVSYGFFPDAKHTFTRPADRRALVARVTDWIAGTLFKRCSPATEGTSPEA